MMCNVIVIYCSNCLGVVVYIIYVFVFFYYCMGQIRLTVNNESHWDLPTIIGMIDLQVALKLLFA